MGGVIPQIAKYYHSENVGPVVNEALDQANLRLQVSHHVFLVCNLD